MYELDPSNLKARIAPPPPHILSRPPASIFIGCFPSILYIGCMCALLCATHLAVLRFKINVVQSSEVHMHPISFFYGFYITKNSQ